MLSLVLILMLDMMWSCGRTHMMIFRIVSPHRKCENISRDDVSSWSKAVLYGFRQTFLDLLLSRGWKLLIDFSLEHKFRVRVVCNHVFWQRAREPEEPRHHLYFVCPYTLTFWIGIVGDLLGTAVCPDWANTLQHLIRHRFDMISFLLVCLVF